MKTNLRVAGFLLPLIVSLSIVTPAAGQGFEGQQILDVLTQFPAGIKDPLNGVLDGAELTTPMLENQGLLTATIDTVRVEIPIDASNAISIDGNQSAEILVQMPFSEQADLGSQIGAGVVAFDNGNDSTSVAVVKEGGSIQFTSIVGSLHAPERFDYSIGSHGHLQLVEAGQSILLMDGERLAGAVAPPWARDFAGTPVPTHYEISGSTLTQVVEHRGGQFRYPIVADPWIGVNLFDSIALGRMQNSQPVVNLDLSGWGWAVYSGLAQGGTPMSVLAGQGILNSAGWDEAWGKGGAIRAALDKPSQRQQFACHALGALFAGQWNLEKFRLNRLNGNWGAGVALHHCNWTTADGY